MGILKNIYPVLLCSLGVFVTLYFINPSKATFPTALVIVLLLVASFLQKATLIETIRISGTRRILFGVIFLLLIVAGFSLNKYLQARISGTRSS